VDASEPIQFLAAQELPLRALVRPMLRLFAEHPV